jgi:hypothetical protein
MWYAAGMMEKLSRRRYTFPLLVTAAAFLFAVLLVVLASLGQPLSIATSLAPLPSPTTLTGVCHIAVKDSGFDDEAICRENVTYGQCALLAGSRVFGWQPGGKCPSRDACNPNGDVFFLQGSNGPAPCTSRQESLNLRAACLDDLEKSATFACSVQEPSCNYEVVSSSALVPAPVQGPSPSPKTPMCTAECTIFFRCKA